ncbi:restriction endonuclease subunit S [Neptuniibacter sp. QD34_54]|uniref:restriction endonuclease subunit S n=1 Tax=Neptuniibacter sp. QD34_54 TaxID=3398208 RepID=UPI0039F5DC45
MSNVVPDGWDEDHLSNVSTIITKGTTPTTNGYQYTASGVKFLRVENISHSGTIIENDLKFINDEANNALKRSQLQAGDLLVSIAGAIGRSAIVTEKNLPANTNQAVGIVRLIPDDVLPKYVRYSIESPSVERQISDLQAGNAQVNLNLQQLGDLRFLRPPLPEQQKIAAILSSVDDVIEKTQAQIDKLKDLKTGMMQELLTKGIGHTDFKDSPVGRIPVGWDVQSINDFVSKVGSGVTPKGGSKAYVEVGIPLIRSQNVYPDGLRLSDVSYITEEQHEKMANSKLQPNDVLLNITGASIGRCYYLPDDFMEGNVNQHVCIIRLKKQIINHVYLTLILNSQFGQSQIMNLQAGGNREGLNFQQIRAIRVAIPPLQEQIKIANAVSSVDRKIAAQNNKLESVKNAKKALMQDLLTGKVRVTVDN